MPYFYTGLWFYLYDYSKKFSRVEAIKKLLDNNIDLKNFSPYFQVTSTYINDLKALQLSLNPNFYSHVNTDGLNENEKKIIYALIASIDLRINKNFVDVIVENIEKEEKLTGKFSNILAKHILKFTLIKNKEYILKSIFQTVFNEHILYKNTKNNTWIVYLNCYKDEEKIKLIKYIKKYFLNYDEDIRVSWDKHFTVISHKIISKIENVINY